MVATASGPAVRQEPLVLLPGTLCDARVFAPVCERLGRSDSIVPVIEGAQTATAVAERMLRTLPPRFALAGFSLGGILALEMADLAPQRITRLALISTTARPDPIENHVVRRTAVVRAAETGFGGYVDAGWASFVGSARRGDQALRALISTMAEECGHEAFRLQSEIAIARIDSRPRLKRIKMPTLVLCGAEDTACPPDRHTEIADGIEGARLVVVPACGHFVPLENPDAVAGHLRHWLATSCDDGQGSKPG